GLVALDRRERSDAPLPLEPHHPLVEAAAEQHGAIEPLQLGGRQVGLEGGINVAIAVENRQVVDVKAGLEARSRHGPGPSALIVPPTSSGRRSARGSSADGAASAARAAAAGPAGAAPADVARVARAARAETAAVDVGGVCCSASLVSSTLVGTIEIRDTHESKNHAHEAPQATSKRCMITMSCQRPNLSAVSRSTPTTANPARAWRRREASLSAVIL